MNEREVSNNRKIAGNTLMLYSRMFLVMLVTLYTSRVALKMLGVDDFGIYQTVGGAVTFLSFLSVSLGTGTSRFITFELGKEKPRLEVLFSTAMIAHIVIGLFIVIVGEVIGLWLIYNKLVIPDGRLQAAVFAFHFSMIGTFFQIVQVPYNASIIAHERMGIYAYISIFGAAIKLGIVFALKIFVYDKLEVYSVLMCAATIIIMLIYRFCCRKEFPETRTRLMFDKNVFKGVASFSGWHLITSIGMSLANQGVTLVTNMFFSPAVVTVRSLALRVNDVINTFIGNFRTAVNPQIIKKYATKDYEDSKKLALASTKYTFYLMLLIVLPLYLLVEPALKIWLEVIPEGLIPFVQLALIQGLFQAFDTSLYAPLYAMGRIKENAIISPLFDALQLPLIYWLFKIGMPPLTLAWVAVFACLGLAVIVKPILVHIIAGYNYWEIMRMELVCLIICIASSVVPFLVSQRTDVNTPMGFIAVLLVSLISVGLIVWVFGIEKNVKHLLIDWCKDLTVNRDYNKKQ